MGCSSAHDQKGYHRCTLIFFLSEACLLAGERLNGVLFVLNGMCFERVAC